MKTLPNEILNAQLNNSISPAFKAQIQAYGMPAESDKIRFNTFDWSPVHQNAGTKGARACCTKNGTLIFSYCPGADYTTEPTIVRWENPSKNTDFSTWAASGTPTWHPPLIPHALINYRYVVGWDIAANPTSDEVILIKSICTTHEEGGYWIGDYYVKYRISIDDGVTWGAWQNLYYRTGATSGDSTLLIYINPASIAFDSSGDCLILVTGVTGGYYKRTSGVWGSKTNWRPNFQATNLIQTTVYDSTKFVSLSDQKYSPQGLGVTVSPTIDFADATAEVNSLKDLSPMSTPNIWGSFRHGGPTVRTQLQNRRYADIYNYPNLNDLNRRLSDLASMRIFGKYKITSEDLINFASSEGVSGMVKIPNFPLIVSICDGDKVTFIYKRDDIGVDEAIFSKAYQIDNAFPLLLCANSEWIFAYNGNQIFMSPHPSNWAPPAAGTGANGAILEYTLADRILRHEEHVRVHSQSTLTLTLNNYDGLYDTAGVGDLAPIKKYSRLGYFKGFYVDGSDETIETQRYFIDDWGYSREPNAPEFFIKCIDAWGLMERYVFPKAARFNFPGSAAKSIYDIIEQLVQSVGGTLAYKSRSPSITSIYPRLFVQPNDNAANVARRLLYMVPDVLSFSGLEGTIIYPLATDAPVYYYEHPQ